MKVGHDTPVVALIGNPNTGKSTLFNSLTGAAQKIANYPGITVEACLGILSDDHGKMLLIDLPGTYSLAAHTPDEQVVTTTLLGRTADLPAPQVVMLVVDASSLDRNLYIGTQILELGLPTVVALTMVDVALASGIEIDHVRLGESLGVPVVPVNPARGEGLDRLRQTLRAATTRPSEILTLPYPAGFARGVDLVHAELTRHSADLGFTPSRPEALRLLVDHAGLLRDELTQAGDGELVERLEEIRGRARHGPSLALVEARARYGQIASWLATSRRTTARGAKVWTERADAILTHPVAGVVLFGLLMGLVFQSIYLWSTPLMDGVESAVQWLAGLVLQRVPPEWSMLRSLLDTGVFGGVAAVLVFLPQILILFLLITLLEDVGYMSRAAFLMDKLLARIGLTGRSFLPLLASFACAVPGIMSARGIRDRDARLATVFLAPFMSCSARLPVYVLFVAAFVPRREVLGVLNLQGLTLFAMYCVGILVAIPTAWVVRKFVLKAEATPFLMELPAYKLPNLRNVVRVLQRRTWIFVKRAGTIIFFVAVLVWAAAYFPHDDAIDRRFDSLNAELEAQPPSENVARDDLAADLHNRRQAAHLSNSYLGRVGRWIEPAVRPLGWDWRIGMAAAASFPAREVIIATMGTIFSLGSEQDESSVGLRDALRDARDAEGRPLFTLATALSVMVFFALCAQCAATLAVMRRETNSWSWPIASFLYMTTLAYVAAFVTYQTAAALGSG